MSAVPRCEVCNVTHVIEDDHITIRDPDDEIVGHGYFHVERMSNHTIWIGFTDPDGGHVALEVYSKTRVKMMVRDER